jgi:hypothetical protein
VRTDAEYCRSVFTSVVTYSVQEVSSRCVLHKQVEEVIRRLRSKHFDDMRMFQLIVDGYFLLETSLVFRIFLHINRLQAYHLIVELEQVHPNVEK